MEYNVIRQTKTKSILTTKWTKEQTNHQNYTWPKERLYYRSRIVGCLINLPLRVVTFLFMGDIWLDCSDLHVYRPAKYDIIILKKSTNFFSCPIPEYKNKFNMCNVQGRLTITLRPKYNSLSFQKKGHTKT